MRVSVVVACRERQVVIALELPEGSRVRDTLAAPAVRAELGNVATGEELVVGIWSRRCPMDSPLREGDRVEIYRPLRADPKAMRRERARLKPSTRPRSRP